LKTSLLIIIVNKRNKGKAFGFYVPKKEHQSQLCFDDINGHPFQHADYCWCQSYGCATRAVHSFLPNILP